MRHGARRDHRRVRVHGSRAAAAARRRTPTSSSSIATADTQAGVAGVATRTRRWRRPTRTSCSSHSISPRSARRARPRVPRPPARGVAGRRAAAASSDVGCVVDLSAAFRLKDPAAYPRGTASSTISPTCSPRPCTGCPSARGRAQRRPAGGHAGLLRHGGDARPRAAGRRRADRADGHHRRRAPAASRAPAAAERRRRSARSTRTSPPTGCSTTGTRPEIEQNLGARGAVHAAPRADEPGHPRHLLRPPGGRHRRSSTDVAARRAGARRTATSRSWSSPPTSPSTKATLGSNARSRHRPLRRAHGLRRRSVRPRQPHQGRLRRRDPGGQRRARPRRDRRPAAVGLLP